MKFFGLQSVSDEPTYNSSIMRAKNELKEKQWKQMKVAVDQLVDICMLFSIVERFMDIQPCKYTREISTREVFHILSEFSQSMVPVCSIQQGL